MADEIDGTAVPATDVYTPPNEDSWWGELTTPDGNDPSPGWFERMTAIADQTKAADQAAEGAGFAFSPEQLVNIADDWDELAGDFENDVADANMLIEAQGPGKEYASKDNANLVVASGDALTETLRQRAGYCRAQAEKFRAAAGKYAEREDEAAADANNAGGIV